MQYPPNNQPPTYYSQQPSGPQWPQQQPMYYPPLQPPKKKSNWGAIILISLLAAVIVLSCIGIAAVVSNAAQSAQTLNTGTLATTDTSTSVVTPSQHFKVGQLVQIGSTWQATVNSVKVVASDQFNTPKAGDHFVVIDITLKNVSSQEQNISSIINFSLQDATGQKYNETILSNATAPDGKVEPGSLLRGQLAYEVPTSQKALTFFFEPSFLTSGQTLWDINI